MANQQLEVQGLVIYTWGNVSAVDRSRNRVVIKPSGVPYIELTPEKMVAVDLEKGKVIEGTLRPSSDLQTHLELYRQFSEIGAVVHTHSTWQLFGPVLSTHPVSRYYTRRLFSRRDSLYTSYDEP